MASSSSSSSLSISNEISESKVSDVNNKGNQHPWIDRDFLKEKLRVRERYWHSVSIPSSSSSSSSSVKSSFPRDGDGDTALPEQEHENDTTRPRVEHVVIPDAIIWRKYLPLLSSLITDYSSSDHLYHWILCESVVEYMDYRSMSPCLTIPTSLDEEGQGGEQQATVQVKAVEHPGPQERSKLLKLLQSSKKIHPFCDLSLRATDDFEDEFDMMKYSQMSIAERSNHALLRAGGIFKDLYNNNTNSNIMILVSDPNLASQFASAEEEGIQLMTIETFLGTLFNKSTSNERIETILELKIRCEEDYRLRNLVAPVDAAVGNVSSNNQDQQHWTDEEIQIGLKNKTLLKGRLDVSKENPKEGFISVMPPSTTTVGPGDATKYFIDGNRGYFNRSIHYDQVVIQPLPESEWGRPIGRKRLVHHRDNDNSSNDNESSEAQTDIDDRSSPTVPSARVVGVIEPSRRLFVATMVETPMKDESACLVIPMDFRIPKIRIRTNTWSKFIGKRLHVHIDNWDIGSNYPSGHCIEVLGDVADLETEITCLLKENQLDLEPFSASALACLPPEGRDWKIPTDEIKNRLDLRQTHRIFSVDPPGCQDIDDTMHARILPNGDIEVGVHIADVTHFLKHKSPLDIQAQARGTTFYLVDRRFDMLPSLLSSDLCSLHGDTDRLAVSTIWTMSRDFKEIKSFWYGKTVIHNCQAMTYGQAHNIIHGKSPEEKNYVAPPPLTAGSRVNPDSIDDLRHDLTILTQLARKLRKDREEIGGAVDLSSGDQGSELKFTLDENNNPVKVTPKKQEEIHGTIAEIMILANTWVAKTIYEKFPNTALLRSHRSVDEDRFGDLKEALKAGKIGFDGKSNMALANTLKKAENDSKSKSLMSLFQSLATRAMSEALYVCTGQVQEAGLSHYGLGLEKYTHFTSPIRRYADVVVHRQLLHTAMRATHFSSRIPVQRLELASLPSSNVISIEKGEGIEVKSETKDGALEVEGLPGLIESANVSEKLLNQEAKLGPNEDLYSTDEVVKLCDGINRQNRMAKFSSFECQNLFLSLYFKENSEMTQAIVTSLRNNGFWAYVPRFDFRGPVYLTDISGTLQIDPTLLSLDPSAGREPTGGFSASGCARMFMSGRCNLVRSPEEHLEITVPENKSPHIINMLDVVTVKICSDGWDARARVPLPRLHLVRARNKKQIHSSGRPAAQKHVNEPSRTEAMRAGEESNKIPPSTCMTLDSDILGLQTPPVLENEPLRTKAASKTLESRGKPTMAGRIVFGEFVNPNTRTAMQEAAITEASEAAKHRRSQAVATNQKKNEYNTTRQIEMDVTARMQRLAAVKRNARKGKGK